MNGTANMDVTTTVILAAIIVAMSSAMTAVAIAYQAASQRRTERRDDQVRQQEIASRAAEQTRLLIETNERIANRTDQAATVLEGKLDVVHGLVNSGLTAAKQSEFDALQRDLASLRALAALQNDVHGDVDLSTSAAIEQVEARAADLAAELDERRAADEVARTQTEVNLAREQRHRRGG